MKFVIDWRTTPEDLEKIAKELREVPIVSIEIDEDVELVVVDKTLRG